MLLDTPPHAARAVIDALRQRFCRSFGATFSAGIAGSRNCVSPQQLIADADAALYVAKRSGRDKVEILPS
jgi:PleD family two-component response regulator